MANLHKAGAVPVLPASTPLIGANEKLEARFASLLEKLRQSRPSDDTAILRRAFDFAAAQHQSQTRESGEPYLSHPLEVAHILADLRLDVTTLCAALLHDVVEDTAVALPVITAQFGPDTARLVEGVTKISRLELVSPEARQVESVRKMLLAMVTDIRVVLVKLADRLHNMRTLGFLPPAKQERIARETLDIYAPIAHRLGMGVMRGDLEDLAFCYLEPTAYRELQDTVSARGKEFEQFLTSVQDTIRAQLNENGINAEVEGRVKRLHSIHQKAQRQKRTLDQVYDLLAVRIITDSVRSCYAALGVVHQLWRPVPGRFKDYIAMPRPNLYQSLHTTVIHAGQSFEVQIRTQEMHRIAEQGVAAHWRYKGASGISEGDDQRIIWMRKLIDWAREMREPSEFMSTLKVDLYPEEVYTFTPKGKVLALPRGATPVDFAYAIHTEVGHQCAGAKVNGQMMPLRHPLSNGDVVEIITHNGHSPSRDWLTFVRTSHARTKIRQWINLNERRQATEVGRKLVEREARQSGVSLKKLSEEDLLRVATEYGRAKVEDLYADLGYGKYSARQVLAKLTGQEVESKQQQPEKTPQLVSTVKRMLGHDPAILVLGQDDLMVYRAKCCNPIPGDPIVGYVTRGRGVAVHNTACPNVQNLLYQSERRIAVQWSASGGATYPVTLVIHAKDRPGLLAEMTNFISEGGANIHALESRPDQLQARIEATVEIADRNQLEGILRNIKRISGVADVERIYRVAARVPGKPNQR
jgi:GTP diphosphokinase / guanosine-3',5'-bis(diphosphate) 3'-diphosphatase